MTSLGYLLWNTIKEKCYADKQEIIEHLKPKICEAIDEIRCLTLEKSTKNCFINARLGINSNISFRTLTITLHSKKKLTKYQTVFVLLNDPPYRIRKHNELKKSTLIYPRLCPLSITVIIAITSINIIILKAEQKLLRICIEYFK